jgi:lipopolysaccharide transport system ATP-binding protein
MSLPIIEVSGLSKRYQLGDFGFSSFRDETEKWLRRMRRIPETEPASVSSQSGEFWALRDVSFTVQPGEVVGIIGRNGAGKSTLLKLLSRITEPTSGEIVLRGRVASLLEVGTGFHPELSGRENIFLNGAILGMRRAEIAAKFDEIVAFAEVEKFIDTPVKRYSSGMYVRLAFAVAAHLEPEILIVDEVLAVGDARFQSKCIGRMKEISKGHGRTILFVSHNMPIVQQLCDRLVWLKDGSVKHFGPCSEVAELYLGDSQQAVKSPGLACSARLQATLRLQPAGCDEETKLAYPGQDYDLVCTLRSLGAHQRVNLWVQIRDSDRTLIASIASPEEAIPFVTCGEKPVILRMRIPSMPLLPRAYEVDLHVFDADTGNPVLESDRINSFDVHPLARRGAARAYEGRHGISRICSELIVE